MNLIPGGAADIRCFVVNIVIISLNVSEIKIDFNWETHFWDNFVILIEQFIS